MKKLLTIILFTFILSGCSAQNFFWSYNNLQLPIKYGKLYNWYAATDSRGIASSGWHVSTDTDFITTATYLGGTDLGFGDWDDAGGPMKETGYTYFNSPNSGATNSSGFYGRAGGIRTSSGSFSSLNLISYIRTLYGGSQYIFTELRYNTDHIYIRYVLGDNAKEGTSIRLVKNSTSLTNGQTGTYTGNDGYVYKTICIGTLEWLSENLIETKYTNGDNIPNVTDNTAWSVLTSGAWCHYNNDSSYQ